MTRRSPGPGGPALSPPVASLIVNIDVDDIERGVRFYTEALGLRVGRRVQHPWVELVGAGVPIYLLEKSAGSAATADAVAPRTYARHWTPVHLDLAVVSLEHSIETALRAGAILESGITEQAYGRIAMLADPFGHGFCLIEFNRDGYDAPGL